MPQPATALPPHDAPPEAPPDAPGPTGHDHGAPAADVRPWTVLILVAVAQFMVVLDVTVVNVALPSIGDALHFSTSQLQWVVTAYALFTGGLMLLGGRLADVVGRRVVFLTGLAIFTAASLASGLAWSADALVVTRSVQGIGAALLLPTALSIVTTSYVGHQRTVALSVWGALGAAGAAAGVLLGGVLTDLLSWEWIFFINVPVGTVVGILATRAVRGGREGAAPRTRLDLVGGATLMGGLLALVLAIQGTTVHGWGSTRTLALLGAAGLLLIAFAVAERRSPQPLVPSSTWRIRSLSSGAVVMLVATGVLVGSFFLNTLYLQRVLNATPLETGLAFLPLTLLILVGAHLASRLMPRTGTRVPMVSGLVIVAGGALLLSGADGQSSYVPDLLPGFLALGLGVGMTFVSVSVASMADVVTERAGLASGLMTTAHELGASLGVAVLATVAAGSGVAAAADLVDGYGTAVLLAAGAALAAAGLAAVLVPSIRPEPGTGHAMH